MATMYYRPYTAEPIRDGELPPFEAMESILPEYQYIFMESEQRTSQLPKTTHTNVAPSRVSPSRVPPGSNYKALNELDATTYTVIDHQIKDLDNYRSAVHRMGHDILTLRNTIRGLETANSNLRRDLTHYNDATRLIIDSTELDGLSKPELSSRYAALKQKLVSQTSDLKAYKDKVQKLQNELIKKNDKEKEYLKMSHAHASQQELLQRLQEKMMKVRKLEDACQQQERVIEKLERVISKLQDKSRNNDTSGQDIKDALSEENRRLRHQIEDLKEQLKKSGRGGEDLEKLELYQALERAEGRIMSLEKQLQENSRTWGRERADMSIRLNEAEHGLGRSAGMVLHDYAILDDRFQRGTKLDPLLR